MIEYVVDFIFYFIITLILFQITGPMLILGDLDLDSGLYSP